MSHGLLIVGGGLAAQRCCESLRALGHDGPVTIAGAEGSEPYDRPPLSKEGLADTSGDPRFRPREWYAEHGVSLRLGGAAVRLHPGARTVELADGERLRYDDLLIATGSRPVIAPTLADFANVQALRTLEDTRRLREALRGGAAVTVIGGGLIGLEVASSARRLGAAVTVVEAAQLPLGGLLGREVGLRLAAWHREDGADLRLGAALASARGGDRVEEVTLADGSPPIMSWWRSGFGPRRRGWRAPAWTRAGSAPARAGAPRCRMCSLPAM
jgi:3-phenylpropionate/trans-cinnamate dioxygenase ferredoxin reductase component